MSEPEPRESPAPSWRRPLLWGAFATAALHGPVVAQHLLWVVVFGTFGVSGLPLGALPVWLASRRERLPMVSGFALGFIAVGLGMIVLVLATIVPGFAIPPDEEQLWREGLLGEDLAAADVDAFFAALRGGRGDMVAVLAATFVAFGGGCSGAITAALRARRRRTGAGPLRSDRPV